MDGTIPQSLVAGSIYTFAGGCVFLLLLNRVLIGIKDGLAKFATILCNFVVIVLGAAVLGHVTGFSPWMILPLVIAITITIGEMRRAVIRRRCAGGQPSSVEGRRFSLRHIVTTTDLAVAHYDIVNEAWDGDRLRVAHVSDLHISNSLPIEYYDSVMDRVEMAKPDLIFFTGDFVTKVEFAELLPDVLNRAKGRLGNFAVLGNHDYWAGGDEICKMLRRSGVRVLHNQSQRIDIDRDSIVHLIGCEDPWGENIWREPMPATGELCLALTHTPDNIYRLSRSGITAVFAGHYHAGQINLPYLGSLVIPSVYGRRFDHGHFMVNGAHLFVTAGIGAVPPLRIYCQPDIFIIDFRGSRAILHA